MTTIQQIEEISECTAYFCQKTAYFYDLPVEVRNMIIGTPDLKSLVNQYFQEIWD